MADDNMKDFEKMNDDDLFSVSGGVSGFNRQRPNTGTFTPKENTVLSGFTGAGNTTGNTGMSGYIGNTQEGDQNPAGLGTATADCPNCNAETVHIIFNGGRGKCTVCGLVRDKV